MFCLYCRSTLPDDSVFCNTCGKQQNMAATTPVPDDTVSATPTQENNPSYQPTVAATSFPYTNYTSDTQSPYGSQSNLPVGTPSYLAPTPRRNRRGLWVGLAVIAAVLLVSGFIFANRPTPAKTLDAFCSALVKGDAQTAYNQFSSGLQARTSEGTLATAISFQKYTSCTHDTPSVSGNAATSQLTLVVASGQTMTFTASLVQENGNNWKIDNIQ